MRYVAVVLIGLLVAIARNAAGQGYGYEVVPWRLSGYLGEGSTGSATNDECQFDAASARCRSDFSGAGATFIVVDREPSIVSGLAAGVAIDIWYKSSVGTGTYSFSGNDVNWSVPADTVGRTITVCGWDNSLLSNPMPIAGVDCDYLAASTVLINSEANYLFRASGAAGTIEATAYNFRYIVPDSALPPPTPTPPITTTTHTVALPSGDVAAIPMEATAGEIIVAAGIALLIGLALFEHLRRLAQGARAR